MTDPTLVLVGHVLTDVDECPGPFDRPDRLVVGEIYVTEPYRGTDLAERLVERAAADARDHGCGELRLNVDVDSDRARYEAVGFEGHRERLTRPVDDP
ncbi:GCN5-related N-acetyltransferase [Halorubrum tebenquichense DSM 14210]|uniref:GCN5-related N-acetyltransferase n=1 Tax=Halorubrum tebenquichense DSM 14210 TaxID=1227485 RepID=M0DMD1_9EURY|nr:GCN5-related N-acetyltransferase [Halorubrum tebenquichense DSM 14210]